MTCPEDQNGNRTPSVFTQISTQSGNSQITSACPLEINL